MRRWVVSDLLLNPYHTFTHTHIQSYTFIPFIFSHTLTFTHIIIVIHLFIHTHLVTLTFSHIHHSHTDMLTLTYAMS